MGNEFIADIMLTRGEVKELADWHDRNESEADGMGADDCAEFHRGRRVLFNQLLADFDRQQRGK